MGEPDIEVSKQTADAIDGDRHASLAMWAAVAADDFNRETRLWLRTVAERLLAADEIEDRRRRPDAVLAAVGLAGNRDKHRALREHASVLEELGATRDRIAAALVAGGLVDADADVRSILDRELRKVRT